MEEGQTYLKGFNTGHKMREYNPELFEKLKPSLSQENEFERGVLEGAMEYEKSMEKDRTQELGTIRDRANKSRDMGQEK